MSAVSQPRPGRPKGLPKTGGRKKGTPNKVKEKKRLIAEAHAQGLQTPLDFLCGIFRDETQSTELRLNAAKAAAPYMHPALKSVDFHGHLTHGISRELAEFIAGNKTASRSFLGFDQEDQEPQAAAD